MTHSPWKIQPRTWDIFCDVVDNWGDIGVCWRLCQQLRAQGQLVRLWLNDPSALAWMRTHDDRHHDHAIDIQPWPRDDASPLPQGVVPHEVVIEAFGCQLPNAFLKAMAEQPTPPIWINLEYLSAESHVEKCHGLPSPVLSGPAYGLTKWFYYPGFTQQTGGLLREPNLPMRQQCFDRQAWRMHHVPHMPDRALLISLFCYEPSHLPELLEQCSHGKHHLLITPGRSATATEQALGSNHPSPACQMLPYTDQIGFDEILWGCDVNFVRGEDSWVRALWAGRPFIWQAYPQHDDAHHAKIAAFLDWLDAPETLRYYHRVWNGITDGLLPELTPALITEWTPYFMASRERLLAQSDLVSGLLAFVEGR